MLSYYVVTAGDEENAKISRGFHIYNGMNCDDIRYVITHFVWSPILWHDGHRLKKNFHYCQILALDFENPLLSVELVSDFCERNGYWYILGTTRNHLKQKGDQPPMDRFRLLLLFDRSITDVEEYEYNMKLITERFGADEACSDGARLYFPCHKIIAMDCVREKLETYPVTLIPQVAPWQQRRAVEKESMLISRYVQRYLSQEIPLQKRNNTCFRLGCEFYRLGISYDEAVELVLSSPTYARMTITHKLNKEIRACLKNGFKSATRDEMREIQKK